jgi:hypothetical protein
VALFSAFVRAAQEPCDRPWRNLLIGLLLLVLVGATVPLMLISGSIDTIAQSA